MRVTQANNASSGPFKYITKCRYPLSNLEVFKQLCRNIFFYKREFIKEQKPAVDFLKRFTFGSILKLLYFEFNEVIIMLTSYSCGVLFHSTVDLKFFKFHVLHLLLPSSYVRNFEGHIMQYHLLCAFFSVKKIHKFSILGERFCNETN